MSRLAGALLGRTTLGPLAIRPTSGSIDREAAAAARQVIDQWVDRHPIRHAAPGSALAIRARGTDLSSADADASRP